MQNRGLVGNARSMSLLSQCSRSLLESPPLASSCCSRTCSICKLSPRQYEVYEVVHFQLSNLKRPVVPSKEALRPAAASKQTMRKLALVPNEAATSPMLKPREKLVLVPNELLHPDVELAEVPPTCMRKDESRLTTIHSRPLYTVHDRPLIHPAVFYHPFTIRFISSPCTTTSTCMADSNNPRKQAPNVPVPSSAARAHPFSYPRREMCRCTSFPLYPIVSDEEKPIWPAKKPEQSADRDVRGPLVRERKILRSAAPPSVKSDLPRTDRSMNRERETIYAQSLPAHVPYQQLSVLQQNMLSNSTKRRVAI